MKAVMYHYVRPEPKDLPHFRYLHIDDFKAQLDHFSQTDRFIGRDEFEAILNGTPVPDDGVILTFDDGFRDHCDIVLPELKKRNLWGVFYVPTGMYKTGKMLDVHRIHFLVGKYGGAKILAWLESQIKPEMIQQERLAEFKTQTYAYQDNDSATTEAKRILNYYLSYDWREQILDKLMAELGDETELISEFYMTPDEIRMMQDEGMVIGSHSDSHPVFSKLERAEQETEIKQSFDFLHQITGGLTLPTFCYPYGRASTYTDITKEILTDNGCRFCFAVEHRDITEDDLRNNPQALPRWDCNQFPHGQSR